MGKFVRLKRVNVFAISTNILSACTDCGFLDYWHNSLFGYTAIHNCSINITVNLYDELLHLTFITPLSFRKPYRPSCMNDLIEENKEPAKRKVVFVTYM